MKNKILGSILATLALFILNGAVSSAFARIQAMQGAGFVLSAQTNATVDLSAAAADLSLNSSYMGDFLVWERNLDEYISTQLGPYIGVQGYSTSPVILRFALNSSGDFYVGTFNGTPEEQLLIFSFSQFNGRLASGLLNFTEYNGFTLDQSVYGDPHDAVTDLDERHNILAFALGEEFRYLYGQGYILAGPVNFFELYNVSYALRNYLGSDLSVIRSALFHQQFDYTVPSSLLPIHTAYNAMWSPIAALPDQSTDLSRGFDISYGNISASFAYITAGTAIYNNSMVTLFGMNNPPDFSVSGGFGDRTWSVTYDNSAQTYSVLNYNQTQAHLFLSGQLPSRVEFSGYSDFATLGDYATIAVLGDIAVSGLTEYPVPGDDNNPAPLMLVVPPSPVADTNDDGDVDGEDLAALAAELGNTDCLTGTVCLCDFDGNGRVDNADVDIFNQEYGLAN